jgi:hypothetical protein
LGKRGLFFIQGAGYKAGRDKCGDLGKTGDITGQLIRDKVSLWSAYPQEEVIRREMFFAYSSSRVS